jgi:hypothetical protein
MMKFRISLRVCLLALLLAALIAPITPHSSPARAAETNTWTQLQPGGVLPSPRYDHVFVNLGDSGRLLLFGGRSGGQTLGDTWIYDRSSNTWAQIASAANPTQRLGAAAAWDEARQRVLVFSGQNGSTFYNDVWAFDAANNVWSQLPTTGTPPVERYGTSAVISGDTLLISHGFARGRFDDTFALDLLTNTWRDVSPAPEARPLKRCLHEAALIEGADGTPLMALYGGCSSGVGPCPQGDTWLFDSASGTWTEVQAASAPAGRSNPSLVAAPGGVLWLYGGRGEGGVFYSDLWSFDAASGAWTQIGAGGSVPSARSSHDAAWQPGAGEFVMFGGNSADGALNDLWVYRP